MTTVTKSIDVHVPIADVYDQWTQFETFPQFMGGVESIRQVDETHSHWTTKIGGVEREFDTVVTEQHPEERVAWKSTTGPDHAGVVTFHRLADDETRVTVQLDWEPEGFVEKVGSVFNLDDHQVQGDLTKFKSYIEAKGAPTGSWRGDVPAGNES